MLGRHVTGSTVGIIGMGRIGQAIATRFEGFRCEIRYHNRSRKDVAYDYEESPAALAEWADVLVVATPGGAQTKALVDADVLAALGPEGYLVNIARGTVVDEDALEVLTLIGSTPAHLHGLGAVIHLTLLDGPRSLADLVDVCTATLGEHPDANALVRRAAHDLLTNRVVRVEPAEQIELADRLGLLGAHHRVDRVGVHQEQTLARMAE